MNFPKQDYIDKFIESENRYTVLYHNVKALLRLNASELNQKVQIKILNMVTTNKKRRN